MFVHPLLQADVSAINRDLNNQKENENGDRTSSTTVQRDVQLSYMNASFDLLGEQERNDFLSQLQAGCLDQLFAPLAGSSSSSVCASLFSWCFCRSFSPAPQKKVDNHMKTAPRLLPLVLQEDTLLGALLFAFHKITE